jgi:hypothetical protein
MWPISRSEILYRWRKYILLGVKKSKISLQSPKTEFGAQNQYGHVTYSIGNFTWSKKKYSFGGRKGENKPSEPKSEFGAQNQFGRVTYPSIGNFTWSKKKYTFGGRKGENKPSEPKNGIWGPKYQK